MTSRGRQRATAAPRQTGVTTFLYDLRHAARALRHHPGFLAVVVLTLGFGIGINTATFSIVNAVLIRPLPFDQPERLVALTERVPGRSENGPFSPPDFLDVQREQQAFDGIAAYTPRAAELSGSGAALKRRRAATPSTSPTTNASAIAMADVADGALGSEPYLHAYEPFSQFPDDVYNGPGAFGRQVKLAVRTNSDPRALVASVRGEIANIDRQLALQWVETMEDRLGASVATRRFSVVTLSSFAVVALLLAAIGLYGLLAFSVADRRREIALRVALGAEPPAILRMVVGHGLKLVALGLTVGALASFGVTRVLTSLLYQTDTHDAVTFAVVPVVLLLISLAACALPAMRALQVEPITALRSE
jgi:FtsX-like permease family protein